jgi:hypothetical protein
MEWSPPGNPVSHKAARHKPSPETQPECHASASLADRRAEERFEAEGSVELRFEDPLSHIVQGSLKDFSKSGFRAAHEFYALHTGQFVQFRHLQAVGMARVMWNRISTEGVETGFLVVEERPAGHSPS